MGTDARAEEIREAVRKHYAAEARKVRQQAGACCDAATSCGCDPAQAGQAEAAAACGCGPTPAREGDAATAGEAATTMACECGPAPARENGPAQAHKANMTMSCGCGPMQSRGAAMVMSCGCGPAQTRASATAPAREADAAPARKADAAAPKAEDAAESCGCGSDSRFYSPEELGEVPEAAAAASLGCGNPMLLAELKPGEVVLDLGSGGGIDVLLSARRVGPTGKAYGLDMTDEMLDLARANARAAGAKNVAFLKGQIEAIPLPDASVDVIISNCVINLSADKSAVLREAFRVLKPGGRFAVADIVVQGEPLSPPMREALALWAGCVAGALEEDEYRQKLVAAGFADVSIEVIMALTLDDLPEEQRAQFPDLAPNPKSKIVSAFVKAAKPGV